MALVVGDVLQIVLEGRSNGEDVTNVFYFGCSNSSSDPGDTYLNVLTRFDAVVLPPLIAVSNTVTVYSQLTVKNLSNELDYAVLTINRTGTLAGAPLPAYITFTAQLVRTTLLTRNGSKRFSGLVEEGIVGNTISWIPAQKTALEQALDATLVSPTPSSWSLIPIIVGRFPQGSPNAGELDLSRTNLISNARLGSRTSSQVSRKLPQVY